MAVEKDSSEIRVGDDNTPGSQLPDAELASAFQRICGRDDVKKWLYEAVNKHKKMTESAWMPSVVQAIISIISIVAVSVVTLSLGTPHPDTPSTLTPPHP